MKGYRGVRGMGDTYFALLRRFNHLRLAVKREIEEWKRGGMRGKPPVAETWTPRIHR
jgi:hypothetical protein